MFEASETKHTVARCKTCREVRPVFYIEQFSKNLPPGQPPRPMHGESWKLNKDGRCQICVKYINTSRKIVRQVKKQQKENNIPVNGVKVAAKFSGIFSQEDDLAYET